MKIKFPKKPFFKKLSLTNMLLPALSLGISVGVSVGIVGVSLSASLYQPAANAAQAPLNNSAANTVLAAPSNAAKQRLMAQLSKLAFFSANFSQNILNGEGEILQQGSGTLAISKPNLVNWKTITPDETLIVSDGNTLWFYDPFIEQASAFSLAKSIHNTPVLLLTSDEPQLWQQYTVSQKSDVTGGNLRFVVIPKDDSSQIKKLTLSFTDSGSSSKSKHNGKANEVQLSEFSFEDATGQVSQISLSHFNSSVKPKASLFTFTLPQGVRLEDKR